MTDAERAGVEPPTDVSSPEDDADQAPDDEVVRHIRTGDSAAGHEESGQ